MKQIQITFFVVTIIGLFISGCSQSEPEVLSTIEKSPTESVEPKLTLTPEPPTATPIPPTLIPEPTNTLTLVPTDSPEPTAISTPLPTATSEPTGTPSTPKKSSANSDPFSFDRLVTASELDSFTKELEIIAWEMDNKVEWEYRLCRSFLGASWSISPNIAYNCVFVWDPTPSLDEVAPWFIDQEILSPTAIALEPSFNYEKGSLLYVDQYDNGHTYYDAFVIGDGVVYWASIGVGTPEGFTPEDVTDAMGHVVEAALNDIAMVNLGQTDPVTVAVEESEQTGGFSAVDYVDATADTESQTEPPDIIQQQKTGTNFPTPQPFDSPTVSFYSSWLAEFHGVSINFQHPRSWQTGYFMDSGYAGWLVSDADPNEAFWEAFKTGEELTLLIIPIDDLSELNEFSSEDNVAEFEADDRSARFAIVNGEVQGYVTKDEIAFQIFGEFPPSKEAEYKEGIETIFTTFNWVDLPSDFDPEAAINMELGLRDEGKIEIGKTAVGYVPLASISDWTFSGQANQEISVSVSTIDPEVVLSLGIINAADGSLVAGTESFTGSISLDAVKLPDAGNYYIRLFSPSGFIRFDPFNPPAETKVYGRYEISLK